MQDHCCLVVRYDERDYVLGDGNITLKANVPNGDWSKYFYFSELQKVNGFETSGCVIFDFQERFDAFMEYLLSTNQVPQNVVDWFHLNGYFDAVNSDDKQPHFHTSPRYLQILTGNGQNGNSFRDPCKAAQNNGMIPWADLPFDASVADVNDYFSPIPSTLLDKGKLFLSMMGGKNFIKYQWIYNNTNGSIPLSSLDQARQLAPMGVGVNVGTNWNSQEPTPPPIGLAPGHAVSNFTRVPDGEMIEDHYVPYHKLLVSGYPIPQAFQMVIIPPLPSPPPPIDATSQQSISAWSKWLSAVSAWLRNIFDPASLGAARSPKWSEVEKAFVKLNPQCNVCGTEKNRNVHHVAPFHLDPAKELDPTNLITLCRNHHLLFGHFMNWSSFNKDVRVDAATWNTKITQRPK